MFSTHGGIRRRQEPERLSAAGVPGTVLGLETARREYGTLPRPALMAPSIRLAEDGFILTRGDVDELDVGTADFVRSRTSPRYSCIRERRSDPERRLVQHDLAATLRAVSADGAAVFYHGAIAEAVAAASRANGGPVDPAGFRRL